MDLISRCVILCTSCRFFPLKSLDFTSHRYFCCDSLLPNTIDLVPQFMLFFNVFESDCISQSRLLLHVLQSLRLPFAASMISITMLVPNFEGVPPHATTIPVTSARTIDKLCINMTPPANFTAYVENRLQCTFDESKRTESLITGGYLFHLQFFKLISWHTERFLG